MSRPVQPLPDLVARELDVLFVGINPSLRSAELRHHFAGRGNRFWKVLYEAGLIPEPYTFEDDRKLPDLGLGLTNIVDRATASCNELEPRDYALGRKRLARKIATWSPKIVAFVGVVVFREFFETRAALTCGPQPQQIGGASVFLVPNPSGRNAHYPYPEMVRLYRALAKEARARA